MDFNLGEVHKLRFQVRHKAQTRNKAVSVDANRLVVRHRPSQSEARVRKRYPKAYPLMTKLQHEWEQAIV